MKREQLLETAFAYKQTKLWKKVLDSELFAVKLPDGKIGYCCVMGMDGEHVILSLHLGTQALTTLRMLAEPSWVLGPSELGIQENLFGQDCIHCAFESRDDLDPDEQDEVRQYARTHGIRLNGAHAFPQFVRYRPQRGPWRLDTEQDEVYIHEALLAAIEVARQISKGGKASAGLSHGMEAGRVVPLLTRNGKTFSWGETALPESVEPSYPSPVCSDELLIARVKKIEKRAAPWHCQVTMFPQPVREEEDDDDSAPVFPYLLLVLDSEDEILLQTELFLDYGKNAEGMLTNLAEVMQTNGVPSKICVRDDRTMALLKSFTGQIGIPLVYEEDLPLLDEAEAELIEAFIVGPDGEGDPEEEIEEFVNMLTVLSPEQLATMPPELRHQLLQLDEEGLFSQELSQKIRSVFEKY